MAWFIYTGNDLTDNLHPDLMTYRMPFVRQRGDGVWEVVTDNVSPQPWTFAAPPRPNLERFAEFSAPSAFGDWVFSAADFLIGQAATVCAEAGAQLALLSIPPAAQVRDPAGLRRLAPEPGRVDLGLPDRRLAQSCAVRNVPFRPLLPRLRPHHYLDDDMHWNAAGHRLAAAALHELPGVAAGVGITSAR